MCGRITLYTPPARLARFFQAHEAEGLERSPDDERSGATPAPSWNVTPSREVLAVVTSPPAAEDHVEEGSGTPHRERLLVPRTWGLVPFWAKDPSIGNRMANARAESVAENPAFRRAFERRRCLVVADGFYEWRAGERPPSAQGAGRRRRAARQPWYFRRADGQPLAFAGLWESWRDPRHPGQVLRTCTIVTTDAGPDVAPVHDRMPAIIEPGDWDEWLGIDDVDTDALLTLLLPSQEGTLVSHPVDQRVNHPEVDDPELLEPVAERDQGDPGDQGDGPVGTGRAPSAQLSLPLVDPRR
jgi:putative SOS response-associated peptidase YedK